MLSSFRPIQSVGGRGQSAFCLFNQWGGGGCCPLLANSTSGGGHVPSNTLTFIRSVGGGGGGGGHLIRHHFGKWTSKFSPLCWFCESAHKSDFVNFNMHNYVISYYAPFSFVSMPLKRDNVLLRDTYAAGLDDPVYSHLAGFANAFRVRGSTIIVYIYCKCLLQTFSKFLALVNCVHAFATMIYPAFRKSCSV